MSSWYRLGWRGSVNMDGCLLQPSEREQPEFLGMSARSIISRLPYGDLNALTGMSPGPLINPRNRQGFQAAET